MKSSFFENFYSQACLNKERIAVILEKSGIKISYGQLLRDTQNVSGYLLSNGVRSGEVVASKLPDGYPALLLFLASSALGVKYAPCSQDDPSALNRISACVKVDHLVTAAETVDENNGSFNVLKMPENYVEQEVSELPIKPKKQLSASLLLLTSGSTGEPKIMVINNTKLWQSAMYFNSLYSTITSESRFWNYLPMNYLGGLFNLAVIPLAVGGSFVLSSGFDATTSFRFWETVKKFDVNTLWLVPSIANLLLQLAKRSDSIENKSQGKQIKTAFIGTAPVGLALKKRLLETFQIRAYENFGLSETTFLSAEAPDAKIGDSSGKILDCVEYKLVKTNFEHDDAPRELYVRTPFMFEGYLADSSSMTSPALVDDYLPTGDMATVKNGELTILGRTRDIIKKGGQFIGLAEVESLLGLHNALAEVAAVKVDDDFYGENYIIFYRMQERQVLSCSELESFLSEHLPKGKMPKALYEVAEIPKTRSGKVRKHILSNYAPYFQNKSLVFDRPALPLSDQVLKIKSALSIDINQIVYCMKRCGEKVITLSLGEAFFDLPEFEFRGINFEKGYHYSDTAGLPTLRERIAEYYRNEYEAPVFADEIVISAGSKPLVFMALKAVLNKGDEVLIHEPGWLSYAEQIKLCDATAKYIPFDTEASDFGKFFKKNTRLIIINNPNNPRGKVYTVDELTEIYQQARSRGSYVLVDEAYSDFVDTPFHSMAEVVPDKDGVIIVNSLSKNFGISGWRIGYVIADILLRNELIKLNQHLITCAPTVLCMYVERYFNELLYSTKQQIAGLLDKRTRLQKFMDDTGIQYLSGGSTFYFFVSIRNFSGTDEEFAKILLIRYKISVVPGSAYGDTTSRFIRLSFGTESDADIRHALDCIVMLTKMTDFDMDEIESEYRAWGLMT